MTKICSKCSINKPLDNYYANKKSIDKKTKMCKDCYRVYHQGRQTPSLRETRRQYRIDNPNMFMYWSAKKRANKFNLDFDLDLEDIIIPEYCPYLGIKLTRIQGDGRQPFNPSLDRIDPSKGYIKGNVEVISNKANIMKNNATRVELITFALNILSRMVK